MELKADIQNENFDLYFIRQLQTLTEYQKNKIPKELIYRIYKGGILNKNCVDKLNAIEKILVLQKSLNKKVFITVEGESGLDIDSFLKTKPVLNNECYSEDNIIHASFTIADKELADAFSMMNQHYVNPMYTHVNKVKNMPRSKIKEYKERINYIVRMYVNYEAKKKRMIMQNGLNMPEFMVLMYLYSVEVYVQTSIIYKEVYRNCFQSSPRRIRQAFCSLKDKGFGTRQGTNKTMEMKITELGKDKVNGILLNYFSNF